MLSSAYSRPIFYYSMTLWLILIMKTECTRLSFYLNSTVELLLHDHWRDLAKEVVLEECPLKRGWSRCKLIIFWIDKMILLLPPLTINNRHRDFSLHHTEGGGDIYINYWQTHFTGQACIKDFIRRIKKGLRPLLHDRLGGHSHISWR